MTNTSTTMYMYLTGILNSKIIVRHIFIGKKNTKTLTVMTLTQTFHITCYNFTNYSFSKQNFGLTMKMIAKFNLSAITKTCPCNIQKFLTAVKIEHFILIFFLIFAPKHTLWVHVRTACQAVLTSTHNLCLGAKGIPLHTQVFLSKSGIKEGMYFTDIFPGVNDYSSTVETSQVLLAGVPGVFSRGSPVFDHLLIGPYQMS